MRILLDTCTFLWWLVEPASLSPLAHASIESGDNELYVSVVTPWEIAIKRKVGRFDGLPADIDERMLEAAGAESIEILPILWPHAVRAGELPLHHRDPFDRMLAAQAQVEKLTLLTPDPLFTPYDVKAMWR